MRNLLAIYLALLVSTAVRSDPFAEEFKQTFPGGVLILTLSPRLENSNRLILKPISFVNRWSPDIFKQYILYEAVFASERRGKLIRNFNFIAREYAAYGSAIFISSSNNDSYKIRYVVSPKLEAIFDITGKLVAHPKLSRTPRELLLRAFLSCGSLLDP